ncbi:MAG: hypothetical protein AAB383_04260 [Patescibacteria group bacterium]
MNRFKEWLGEGLILVPTVLLLGFLLFTLTFRLGGLSNVAELLPEGAEAFFVVNMEDFAASGSPVDSAYFKEFLGTPLAELTWFKRDLAVAWIDGNTVEFLEMGSRDEAETFFTTLVEGGEIKVNDLNENIRCYEIEAFCFRFIGGMAAFSSSPEALATLGGHTPRLEDNPHYQNVRGRLGHLQSGLAFVNLGETQQELSAWAAQLGLPQTFTESILQIFPAWGASIRMESTGWYAESFTAVNKELIRGAYFHPAEKYEQQFLPWTKSFAWEFGTQDLAAQLTRMQEIFTELGSTGEMIFTSSLQSAATDLFGPTTLPELLPLLDGESYFGWTSADDFLFILELETVEDGQSAETLKNRFIQTFTYKEIYTAERGEQKAELLQLTEVTSNGTTLLMAGDQTVAALVFTEDAVIVAPDEAALLAALDRQRNLEEMSVLLPGSTEIWILDGAFLPETNILKTHLSTLTRLMSTRKIFDDGVFTRTSLLPSL